MKAGEIQCSLRIPPLGPFYDEEDIQQLDLTKSRCSIDRSTKIPLLPADKREEFEILIDLGSYPVAYYIVHVWVNGTLECRWEHRQSPRGNIFNRDRDAPCISAFIVGADGFRFMSVSGGGGGDGPEEDQDEDWWEKGKS